MNWKRTLIMAVALAWMAGTGCTIISYDRAFPKLDWYWSKEARQQRAENESWKAYEKAVSTNNATR